jgi:hypothetical protein
LRKTRVRRRCVDGEVEDVTATLQQAEVPRKGLGEIDGRGDRTPNGTGRFRRPIPFRQLPGGGEDEGVAVLAH